MAQKIDFAWDADAASEYYQLFEDGVIVADNIVTPDFSLLMVNAPQGEHSYAVRGVGEFGEGALSDPLTVNFTLPAKIQNLRYSVG